MDHSQILASTSVFTHDYQFFHLVYFSFRTNESEVVIKHKVKVILQKIQNLKVGTRDCAQGGWCRGLLEL